MNVRFPCAPRRRFLKVLTLTGGPWVVLPRVSPGATAPEARPGFNVLDFGATRDGKALATAAIQSAVDRCGEAGGGTVRFPPGSYLSGTIVLRNRVTLHLESGALLRGSPRLEDYPSKVPALRSYTDHYTERSLLYGENLEGITLEGRGTIDGQGAAFKGAYKLRPYLLRLISCRDVLVRDLTLRDSPMWVQHYLACDDVRIDGLTVRSRCNHNNDGIDIDGCHRVRIANCDISSGDDAIVLKSTLDRACEAVVISNCILSSACNAFKLGTESNGGFRDIALTNCVLHDTGLAGLALELVDGGVLDGITISNVTMRHVNCPVFVRLGNRARPFRDGGSKPGLGSLRNISISHVLATGANSVGCSITGLPSHPAECVTLDDVRIEFAGGGKPGDSPREIPEHPDKYPEYAMFGILPAYGFYCRHARGLSLRQVQVTHAKPDGRPSLVCDDVEDLEVIGWKAKADSSAGAVVRFHEVRNGLIRGARVTDAVGTFLRVEGRDSQGIRLGECQLSPATRLVTLAEDVSSGAVRSDPEMR